ncbi:C4-dicarboxylate ABC transporter permease [Rhodobaculum claviforme]|uniref:TRAP transporter small permease protein n=1 Tax=Rhodobaculum claviforme TaxID=1549854 RepID=A0A934WK06_9RHOB|nr:TRAP transporter small permease [Rhodobaculum claviforme]MBK5928502.1 C4-dicarboxylate ABC transporter permease [Rhodobaculum claviforme]
MRRLEQGFVALNAWVVIACLAVMAGVVFVNVCMRYFANTSIPWADELARYLMIWMTFLGAGLVLRQGGHVAITSLRDALPGRVQMVLRAALVCLLMGFFAYMVWVGWDYMNRARFQRTPALRLSFRTVYAAMPIGFALLMVHLALIAPRFIRVGRTEAEDDMTGGQHG